MPVRSLGWEDLLEEGMATHSSIPARRISWTESLVASVHAVTNSWTQLNSHFRHSLNRPLEMRVSLNNP